MPPVNDPVEEEVKKEGEEVDKAAEALRIAKELEEKLKKPITEEPVDQTDIDPAELLNDPNFKAKAKETTGMTDAQVEFTIRTAQAAASAGNAKAALAEVKLRHPDFAKHEKAIMLELKNYPSDKRGNATIIEKLYYVERGKEYEKNNGTKPAVGGMPIRGGNPTGQGLDNDGGRGGNGSLTEEERYVAKRMNISEKDYTKSKGTKLINDLIE
jgi:hypothetical protein